MRGPGARGVPFWLDTELRPDRRAPLDGDASVDLAIVGGGFTGLWAAVLAAEQYPAWTITLLDGGDLGWAASGRNGGFCSSSLTHGLGNGLLVAKVGVNPLIATLGMMSVVRGMVLLITSGFGIPNLPDSFNVIAQGKAMGLQFPVFVMIVCVVVGDILLRRSSYFRQSYFVGGNIKSARLSGIRVGRVQIVNYIIVGVMAAIAGLLLTAPVKAPFSYPKSSDSRSSLVKAPQLRATKGSSRRRER